VRRNREGIHRCLLELDIIAKSGKQFFVSQFIEKSMNHDIGKPPKFNQENL